MIGKKVLEEKPVTLAEAKEILSAEKKKREEQTYEQKITYTYLNKMAAAPTKTEKAKNALIDLGFTVEEAVQLVNTKPEIPEQVQAMFQKRKIDKGEIEKILDILSEL